MFPVRLTRVGVVRVILVVREGFLPSPAPAGAAAAATKAGATATTTATLQGRKGPCFGRCGRGRDDDGRLGLATPPGLPRGDPPLVLSVLVLLQPLQLLFPAAAVVVVVVIFHRRSRLGTPSSSERCHVIVVVVVVVVAAAVFAADAFCCYVVYAYQTKPRQGRPLDSPHSRTLRMVLDVALDVTPFPVLR